MHLYLPQNVVVQYMQAVQIYINKTQLNLTKNRTYIFIIVIIIIVMTRRQLRSVATTLHDDRDPVPSSTPV